MTGRNVNSARPSRSPHAILEPIGAKHLGEMSVQHEPQRRVDLVLGSAILAILSLPAIVFIGWMIVQSV